MSDDEIPPPLIPDPAPQPFDTGDTLYIPFLLADAPRQQLNLISRHTSLPEAHRKAIADWIRSYNVRLMKWLHDAYGPEAVRAADALSRAAAGQMSARQRAAQQQAERDLFAHLEEEMGRDDDQ